jgi:hypothetical protein
VVSSAGRDRVAELVDLSRDECLRLLATAAIGRQRVARVDEPTHAAVGEQPQALPTPQGYRVHSSLHPPHATGPIL